MAQAPLTLDDLDTHLFKCADIIRNTVDKTDYKDYILSMVFYKTISDTYQDQYEEHLEEYGDPEIAKRPAFYEPLRDDPRGDRHRRGCGRGLARPERPPALEARPGARTACVGLYVIPRQVRPG